MPYQQGRRRRMDKFSLGEISAVDRPAQSGALSSIQKKEGEFMPFVAADDERFTDEEWEALQKMNLPGPSAGEARDEYLARLVSTGFAPLSKRALEAYGHSRFEHDQAGEWEAPEPGETLKSFADRAGVTEDEAREAFVGSHSEELMQKRGDLVDMMTSIEDGHQHGVSIYEYGGEGFSVMVQFAASEEGEMHDHQIIVTDDGTYQVSQNRGHNHTIDGEQLQSILLARISKSAEELTKAGAARQERGRLARLGVALPDGSFPIRNSADLSLSIEGFDKCSEEDRAELAAHIEKRAGDLGLADQLPEKGNLANLLVSAEHGGGSVGKGVTQMPDTTKELDALKAQNDRLSAIVALPAIHKAHFDALETDEAKDEFLASDAEKRDEIVTDAQKAKDDEDPVVYKSIDGEVFRKSDDDRIVRMAKRADEDRKENLRLRKAAEDQDLTKRAEGDLANFPGEVNVRKAIIKAVDGIEDETVRGEAINALKAQNARLGKNLTSLGTTSTGDLEKSGSRDGAADELDSLAKAKAEADGIPFLEAYEKVSEAHPQLLAKAIAG